MFEYHWYVNVDPPGSVTFAVNTIEVHSSQLLVIALAVGVTLVHVPVATVATDSLPSLSLTFTRNGLVTGSFSIHKLNELLACHPLRLVPLVLKLYGVVWWSQMCASVAAVTLIVRLCASATVLFAKVNVGAVVSRMISSKMSVVILSSESLNLI